MEIVETVDGRFMILVNGFQWGRGKPDASGAHPDTFDTVAEAQSAWIAGLEARLSRIEERQTRKEIEDRFRAQR